MNQSECQSVPNYCQFYICQHCSNIFSQKSDMEMHILMNHTDSVNKIYTCEICRVCHDTLSSMRQHMDSHITVHSYVCNICGQYFKNVTLANNHVLTVHKNTGGVGIIKELSANLNENHHLDGDNVIHLNTKWHAKPVENKNNIHEETQNKNNIHEETQNKNNIHEETQNKNNIHEGTQKVEYKEGAEPTVSTGVDGNHKTYILYIEGERTHNADADVYNDNALQTERPVKDDLDVMTNDYSVETDNTGKSSTDATDIDALHFEEIYSNSTDISNVKDDKETNQTNTVKYDRETIKSDTYVPHENAESCVVDGVVQECAGSDHDYELQEAIDNLEEQSDLDKTLQKVIATDQILNAAKDVSMQTMKLRLKSDIIKEPAEVRNSKLTCEICGSTLRSKSAFKAHLKIHDDIRPYQCLTCGRSFRQRCHLKDHEETHKGDDRERKFECSICHKRFFDKRVLNSHRKTHLGIINFRQFKCDVCQKTFKRKCHLQEHSAIHLEHRPVVRTCSTCNTGFKSESSYNKHMLRHQAGFANKFKCDLCSFSFKTQSKLATHVKNRHDKEKPFSCTVCHQTFTRRDTLREHQAVHERDREKYSCDKCERNFLTKRSLEKHIMIYHKTGEAVHCKACDKPYLHKSDMIQHKKRCKLSEIQGKEQHNKSRVRTRGNPKGKIKGKYIQDNVVNEQLNLATVITDGVKIEIHVHGEKLSKPQANVNNFEHGVDDSTSENDPKPQDGGKQERKSVNDCSPEEIVEMKQSVGVDVALDTCNSISKEGLVYQENSMANEMAGLTNSSQTNTVSVCDDLNSVNKCVNDIGINTIVMGKEQISHEGNDWNTLKKKRESSKVCPICGAKFGSPQAQVRHVKTIHGEKVRFMCEICGLWLSSKAYLQTHKQRDHQGVCTKRSTRSKGQRTKVCVIKLEKL